MKNFVIALVVTVSVLAGIYYLFIYNPCKEPEDLQVAVAGLECTVDLFNKPVEQLRTEFCIYLGREAECELNEELRPQFLEMINQQILVCTQKKLAAQNLCTDKVEAKLRGE